MWVGGGNVGTVSFFCLGLWAGSVKEVARIRRFVTARFGGEPRPHAQKSAAFVSQLQRGHLRGGGKAGVEGG